MKTEYLAYAFCAFVVGIMFYVQQQAITQRDAALALARPKITTSAGVITVECKPRETD